jgi:hypothetical protein
MERVTSMGGMQMLKEADLIKQLREEAKDVKGCFTTYSMQALVFSSLVLTAIFGTMEKVPLIVLSGIPVIILLMIICRVGIYKYATANRLYGYELHLARTRHFGQLRDGDNRVIWKEDYRKIRWEEAQRAWRVVQTCLFRKIYETPEINMFLRFCHTIYVLRWVNYLWPFLYTLRRHIRRRIKKMKTDHHENEENKYPWFLLKEITAVPLTYYINTGDCQKKSHDSCQPTKEGQPIPNKKKDYGSQMVSCYHAGTYLKNILSMIVIMQYILLLPLVIAILMPPNVTTGMPFLTPNQMYMVKGFFVVMIVLIALRYLRVSRRRMILEEELLSIHSCAIVWQIVVMAHFRALGEGPCRFQHYTRELTKAAEELSIDVLDRGMFMGTIPQHPQMTV